MKVDLRNRHQFCKQEQALIVILISQKRKLGLRALSDLIEVKLLTWCCQKEVRSRSLSSKTRDRGIDVPRVNVSPLKQYQYSDSAAWLCKGQGLHSKDTGKQVGEKGVAQTISHLCLGFKEPGSNLRATVYPHMCNPNITQLHGRDFWYQVDSWNTADRKTVTTSIHGKE